MPNRFVGYGPPGIGKTSLGSQWPGAVMQEISSETGFETLMAEGQLPEGPFLRAPDWQTMLGQTQAMLTQPHPHKTLVVDTLNLAERLCHEHVCDVHFQGNWGRTGFLNFMQGFEMALPYLREWLTMLDRLREERKMGVVLLAHSRIKNFSNPEGANYDRFIVDCHEKTWSLIDRWADCVLFINYETSLTEVTETGRAKIKKGKGVGSDHRIIYTRRTAAFDAKNRLGLPAEIDGGDDYREAFVNFLSAVKIAKQANRQQHAAAQPQEETVNG